MKKWMKIASFVIMIALILQTGYSVYATVSHQAAEKGKLAADTPVESSKEEIREETERTMKAAPSPNPSSNPGQTYAQFLIEYDVHDSLQASLDQWVEEGKSLADVMIAYAYLYHHFGLLEEIEPMLIEREQGADWAAIFTAYQATHPPFVPRSFEEALLEQIFAMPDIEADDIMLADVVSTRTNVPIEEVLRNRTDGTSWKDIAAAAGLLFSADKLPTVPVTVEDLNRYTTSTGLTEDQVIDAFVIAYKVGVPADAVMDLVKAGATEEEVYAAVLEQTFVLD